LSQYCEAVLQNVKNHVIKNENYTDNPFKNLCLLRQKVVNGLQIVSSTNNNRRATFPQ